MPWFRPSDSSIDEMFGEDALLKAYLHDNYYLSKSQAIWSIVYALINANIVSLPYAASESGILLFIFLVIVVAIISGYTSCMVISMGLDHQAKSIADLSEKAFGRVGFYVVSYLQIILSISLMCISLSTFSEISSDIVRTYTNHGDSIPIGSDWMWLFANKSGQSLLGGLCMLPLCVFSHNMISLRYMSSIVVLAIFIALIFVIGKSISENIHHNSHTTAVEFVSPVAINPKQCSGLTYIVIVPFCFSCNQKVLSIYSCIRRKNEERWKTSITLAFTLVTVLYILFGCLGYWSATYSPHGLVYINFFLNHNGHTSIPYNITRGLVAVSLLMSFPVDCLVAVTATRRLYRRWKKHSVLKRGDRPRRQRNKARQASLVSGKRPDLLITSLSPSSTPPSRPETRFHASQPFSLPSSIDIPDQPSDVSLSLPSNFSPVSSPSLHSSPISRSCRASTSSVWQQFPDEASHEGNSVLAQSPVDSTQWGGLLHMKGRIYGGGDGGFDQQGNRLGRVGQEINEVERGMLREGTRFENGLDPSEDESTQSSEGTFEEGRGLGFRFQDRSPLLGDYNQRALTRGEGLGSSRVLFNESALGQGFEENEEPEDEEEEEEEEEEGDVDDELATEGDFDFDMRERCASLLRDQRERQRSNIYNQLSAEGGDERLSLAHSDQLNSSTSTSQNLELIERIEEMEEDFTFREYDRSSLNVQAIMKRHASSCQCYRPSLLESLPRFGYSFLTILLCFFFDADQSQLWVAIGLATTCFLVYLIPSMVYFRLGFTGDFQSIPVFGRLPNRVYMWTTQIAGGILFVSLVAVGMVYLMNECKSKDQSVAWFDDNTASQLIPDHNPIT